MQEQLVKGPAVHAVGVRRDCGLLREDDLARRAGAEGEQPPVHEPAVAQVGVVDLLRRPLEHLVHERLGRVALGLVDEDLDRGGEERELHLRGLLEERVREVVHQLVRVLDAVRELPDDPDHGGFALWLVERVEVCAEGGDDAFVSPGVSPEDILDDDHGFLHDIGDLCLDKFKECFDAVICGWLDLDSQST